MEHWGGTRPEPDREIPVGAIDARRALGDGSKRAQNHRGVSGRGPLGVAGYFNIFCVSILGSSAMLCP
eukprot:scaffold4057_cov129-Isochrysis_galbana.AAC.3